MIKHVLFVIAATVALPSLAQVKPSNPNDAKRPLTLTESVREQYRTFGPDRLTAFSWVPGSDVYVWAENYTTLKKVSTKKGATETWCTIEEVNTALGAKLFGFYSYSWKNGQEMFIDNGQQFYVYNPTTKAGKLIASVGENGENATFEKSTGAVAFTEKNNLFIQHGGEKITVTNNDNPTIVSGQSIARNEFGIAGGIFWSPKGASLAFYQKDEASVADYPLLDINQTPGALQSIKYPMAGQLSEKPRVGIYNLASKKTVFITPKGEADSYLTNLSWTPDEKYVLIAEVNRDQNHYWLNLYDAAAGAFVRTLVEESSDKWVEPEHAAFFPDATNNFVWVSEKDGFANLYYYDIEGKLIRQLTNHKFVVKSIEQSVNGGKAIIYKTTGTSPLNTLYYMVDLEGKHRNLTIEEGTHTIYVNSTGTMFVDEYSSHTVPSKTELKNMSGKIVKNLLTSANKLDARVIGTADIGQIKGPDGTMLYTRMIKPSNFDPTKKYPVMVYVYGGPHAQMITNSWLDGANLWMYWMAEQGYIVFTLDNRGSAERGVAFESQIHRQLGVVEMQDQMAGVEYLKSLPFVDGSRLAVHGWSFGGFMTTSLMLRQPGTFNVGVAGGPVVDWKWYEIMYGERYMDRPEQNPAGYEQASLLTYAKDLKGDLLLIHGTSDDVVVMQHNLALVKKFVELGIQMDFFPYPMHKHNVTGKDRVHLMEKVLTYIIEHNNPTPAGN